jgi:hypothetical protein
VAYVCSFVIPIVGTLGAAAGVDFIASRAVNQSFGLSESGAGGGQQHGQNRSVSSSRQVSSLRGA